MTCIEFRRSSELTSGTLTFDEVDRWLAIVSAPIDPVPGIVRYRHHPRVGPSNPQMPRTRYNKAFRGHRFRVGGSKK